MPSVQEIKDDEEDSVSQSSKSFVLTDTNNADKDAYSSHLSKSEQIPISLVKNSRILETIKSSIRKKTEQIDELGQDLDPKRKTSQLQRNKTNMTGN